MHATMPPSLSKFKDPNKWHTCKEIKDFLAEIEVIIEDVQVNNSYQIREKMEHFTGLNLTQKGIRATQ